MNHTNSCFPSDIIKEVERDELDPKELAAIEDHVTECSACRELFEAPMKERDWTERILPALLEPYDENLEIGTRNEPFNHDSLLQLLGPSDDPRMLGRIGAYEVIGVVGTGGMGVVFKAFDASLDRIVAIKMLLPHLAASRLARKRFSREGKAAAAVVDDHVLPIYGVDEWKGVPYLVTQYSNGVSLQKRIRDQGPLELEEILRISIQSARGLAAAHAQGLVHRDVKPSNILLDRTVERALLTDFGLARAADDSSLTRTGTIAGTPHYMSPEQVRNEPINARSDLFSLGCTMYAMCSGQPPFRAESSYAVLRRITDETPRALRKWNDKIPDWFESIVMKLLSKSPDDRFHSAEEVAELLESCLAHVQQPETTPLPKLAAKLLPRRDRVPPIFKWIAAGAATLALIVAGVVIVLELNKGVLTIESDADDVPIRITQDNKVVEQMVVTKQTKSVRLAWGTYSVEFDGQFDGVIVNGESVSLRRGGVSTVRVRRTRRAQDEVGESVAQLNDGDVDESQSDNVIVDLYCGADVLPQMNARGGKTNPYVRMLKELNAIENVVVNFRQNGDGNVIFEAIVRGPWYRSRSNVVPKRHEVGAALSDAPTEKQIAVSSVLRAAGITKVRWDYSGASMQDSNAPAKTKGTLQPSRNVNADVDASETSPIETKVSANGRAVVMLMHPELPNGNEIQQNVVSVVLGQLAAKDYAGVLTFTPGGTKWAWGGKQGLVAIGQRRAKLLKSIFESTVADSPEYDVALRSALDAFANVDAAKKRMIILTNGDPSLRHPVILDEFREQGIVIAVVHVTQSGDKYAKTPTMMARRTGGKYYRIDTDRFNVSTVETIFFRETVRMAATPTR